MTDRDYMRFALDLAEAGRLTARPNPMVGVVVVKDGSIVGSGYHVRPGEGHAEVNALAGVPDEVALGSTVYVTLEPCSFEGRTPPCADLLVRKQVAGVVCAMEDPDERVHGNGFRRLREAGIEVSVGVLSREAARLNAAYVIHRTEGRPMVTLKTAQSLDGSVATASGDSKWITGVPARRIGHRLRAEAQAICVGVGTVLADDPQLNVRHVEGADPTKVILDSQLRTPMEAKVLAGGACIVCVTEAADEDRVKRFEDRGVTVWVCGAVDGRPDLHEILNRLGEQEVIHLLVEGGRGVASSFARAGLIDRVRTFVAPRLVGGLSSLSDLGIASIDAAPGLRHVTLDRVGPDLLVSADVVKD